MSTPRLRLPYPDTNDPADIPADTQALAEAVDAAATGYAGQGTLAARPAAGILGRLYWATDARKAYYDDSNIWNELGPYLTWQSLGDNSGDTQTGGTWAQSIVVTTSNHYCRVTANFSLILLTAGNNAIAHCQLAWNNNIAGPLPGTQREVYMHPGEIVNLALEWTGMGAWPGITIAWFAQTAGVTVACLNSNNVNPIMTCHEIHQPEGTATLLPAPDPGPEPEPR